MNESSQTIYINESGIVVLEIEKDKRTPMMIAHYWIYGNHPYVRAIIFSQKTTSFTLHHKPKMHCVE